MKRTFQTKQYTNIQDSGRPDYTEDMEVLVELPVIDDISYMEERTDDENEV